MVKGYFCLNWIVLVQPIRATCNQSELGQSEIVLKYKVRTLRLVRIGQKLRGIFYGRVFFK